MDSNVILKILGDLTLRTGFPVPIDRKVIYKWSNGIALSTKSDIMLYTGALYQLIPYINATVNYLERLEKTKSKIILIQFASYLVKFSPKLLSVVIKPDENEIKESERILRSIVKLIKKVKEDIGYLYEDDLYSGVLLYDVGLDDYFELHAKKVYSRIKKRNVNKVITIDPHTTYVLREIYPKFIDNFNLEVINYIELLNNSRTNLIKEKLNIEVTIHDPCYYARFLNIIEEPREILRAFGITIKEVRNSKKLTYCCGGPLELFSPKYSSDIARIRIKELSSKSKTIITMCPICKASLNRVKPNDIILKDLSEILT